MDENLKAWDRALNPRRALKLLRETSSGSGLEIGRLLRIATVKHKPGCRLTVRYDVEAGWDGGALAPRVLYGKLYRGRRGERVYQTHRYLRSLVRPTVQFPEALGYHAQRRFLLLDGLEGLSLADGMRGVEAHIHLAHLGHCLTALHSSLMAKPTDATGSGPCGKFLGLHDARAESSVVAGARERIEAAALPAAVKRRFRAAHARLAEGLVPVGSNATALHRHIVHRDLHPQQVILLEGRIGLLDLDEVSVGEAELDVGNLVAHLILEDLQWLGVAGLAPFLTRAFLRPYMAHLSLERERMALYLASALLRLASLRRLSQSDISVLDWPYLAGALIKEAVDALSGAWLPSDDWDDPDLARRGRDEKVTTTRARRPHVARPSSVV
ncbi:MAG: phosphotransferase [Candidatus Eisenbacteria sp.]|nr:phosphotransferase [Candidatus Eisenbacteria bacterium]